MASKFFASDSSESEREEEVEEVVTSAPVAKGNKYIIAFDSESGMSSYQSILCRQKLIRLCI